MQQLSDPYRALGVSFGATDAEIKAAHRKLVKRFHPDSGTKSEPERFLLVQEAYRVLSDPLLRKEWDQKHAPGPIRADRSAAPSPTVRRRRPTPAKPEAEPGETAQSPRDRAQSTDPRTRPRSSRAYTWSASEVPWWEESRDRKQGAKQRQQPGANNSKAGGAPPDAAPPEAAPPPDAERNFAQQDFDVYNRSSGAAWSSAARAYFRKGEQDLPRRGSFHHQGTQPVTAGRARAAVEAEARRRAAAAAAAAAAQAEADVYATPRTQAQAAPGPREGTTHIVRRSIAAPWPSLLQRFGFAIVAWVPIATVVALASQSSSDELMGIVLTSTSLVVLLALPRIAYIAALSTVLALVIGGLFLGGILLSGGNPSVDRLLFYVGALLVVGYIATAAAVIIGPSTLRPWSAR